MGIGRQPVADGQVHDLSVRLSFLRGMTLYIERDCWRGGPGMPSGTIRSIAYRTIRSVELDSHLRLMCGSDVLDGEKITAAFPVSEIVSCRWFCPGPEDVGDALEDYVQKRKMTPLDISTRRAGDDWARTRMYIIPPSVLKRPENTYSMAWFYGEPWCHKCNETFFWSKNVVEAPTYRSGRGLICGVCGYHMPY